MSETYKLFVDEMVVELLVSEILEDNYDFLTSYEEVLESGLQRAVFFIYLSMKLIDKEINFGKTLY